VMLAHGLQQGAGNTEWAVIVVGADGEDRFGHGGDYNGARAADHAGMLAQATGPHGNDAGRTPRFA